MRRKYPKPKVGDIYGRWTVLEIPDRVGARTKIPCRCACGRGGTPRADSLVRGRSRGCHVCGKNLVAARIARLKYGFIPKPRRSRLCCCVNSAIHRCHNPKNRSYHNYGGRGISVFPAWRNDRALFVRYLMTLPGWDTPDLQIDRIDNGGNYEPGNLRFVTRAENLHNRRGKW